MKEDSAIQELENAAKQGDIDACRELGILYYEGNEVAVDLEKSAYYFSKAAKAGDCHSMYCMGLNYIGGTGVPQDAEKGFYWFEEAAKKGDSYAMFELASHYYTGDVVKQDYAKALDYYEQAAQHGNIYAMINAAKLYENGHSGEKDIEKARVFFQEGYKKLEEWAIEEDDDLAQEWLGELYYAGCPLIDVKIDYPQAVVWFEKAAKAGNISALINLGLCYRYGIGTIVDMGKAIELNEKAAAKNETKAMCNLASIYSMGEGVEKDEKKAVELWAKAANLGDPIGQSCLGEMYMLGKGVTQNYTQAAYWSRKAHEGGADGATDNLAILYQKGLGVEKDEKKAFSLYSEAAERNNLHSRVSMAECYIEGLGTKQDLNKAYKILESICNEEEEMREESVTYIFNEGSVYNPFNYQDVEFYAKAYYLLGTLIYAGKGPDGKDASKSLALLRMAERLGFKDDELKGASVSDLISKIEDEAETTGETNESYIEIRDLGHRGKMGRYDIYVHHADGTESIVRFGTDRRKFCYLLLLLLVSNKDSVQGLMARFFCYGRDRLVSLANISLLNDEEGPDKWIEKFIYSEVPMKDEYGNIGYSYEYANWMYSNEVRKASEFFGEVCSNDELEQYKIRSTGGRNSITTIAVKPEQIVVPESLVKYTKDLPTRDFMLNYKQVMRRSGKIELAKRLYAKYYENWNDGGSSDQLSE